MSDLKVADNLVVGMEYVLILADGQVIDQSQPGEPLYYLQGHQNIIPGLEKELAGLSVGDEKEVTVAPADAYGESYPENVQEIPKDLFPEGATIFPGMPLQLNNPETGQMIPAQITEVKDDVVIVDMNHPLAGETLTFNVRIAAIREASAEELEHGHAHGVDGDDGHD